MKECKHCKDFIYNDPYSRKEFCGTVCQQAYSKGQTRERWHKFYDSMTYHDQLLLDEIIEDEARKRFVK